MASNSDDEAVLTPSITKGLNDKLYEKRKNAALEVERLVKQHATGDDIRRIRLIIASLRKEFVFSANAHSRKGGLIGLAAVAIALGQHFPSIVEFLPDLVPPVLSCFTDPDSRVRYYTCESLYNIAKLAADPDPSVKNGAELLDRLIKDIVTEENAKFEIQSFIPLLQERIHAMNPHVRQFLVSWMTVLDCVPNLDFIQYLPVFLQGLFKILGDPNLEIRRMCEACLLDFLRKIQTASNVDHAAMVRTIVAYCGSDDRLTKYMAINWLNEFISLAGPRMLPFATECVGGILPSLSYGVDGKLRDLASETNKRLKALVAASAETENLVILPPVAEPSIPIVSKAASTSVSAKSDGVDKVTEKDTGKDKADKVTAVAAAETVTAVAKKTKEEEEAETVQDPKRLAPLLVVLTLQLINESVATRIAALRWILMLHEKMPDQIYKHTAEFIPALLKSLSDPTDKVVQLDLEVLGKMSICSSEDPVLQAHANVFFDRLIVDILALFSTDHVLLEKRGSFIIRTLSELVNGEAVYRKFAGFLQDEEDLEFADLMVQNLNLILLTTTELAPLRSKLKKMESPDSRELFCVLYRTWSHSRVATFSLCLLGQVYDVACELLTKFAELEVTVSFLVEVDKLIQLLESPIFTYLRLQLLEPQRYGYLIKALYGLVMLLPQSSAYHTMKNRLDCLPTIISALGVLDDGAAPSGKHQQKGNIGIDIDFKKLHLRFDDVQKAHTAAIASGHRSRTAEGMEPDSEP